MFWWDVVRAHPGLHWCLERLVWCRLKLVQLMTMIRNCDLVSLGIIMRKGSYYLNFKPKCLMKNSIWILCNRTSAVWYELIWSKSDVRVQRRPWRFWTSVLQCRAATVQLMEAIKHFTSFLWKVLYVSVFHTEKINPIFVKKVRLNLFNG